MSAAGNRSQRTPPARGFTLLELLLVVAIVAIAAASVSFALRDSTTAQLEQDAQRLAALLESARAESRTRGVPVRWRATSDGFRFDGLPPGTLPERWLGSDVQVMGAGVLLLGPEPLIAAQQVELGVRQVPSRWRVSTDGLRPFAAQAMTASAPP